ncbi:MAG: hypothetical protein NUV49_04120, partial [Patescibacteria group bacterium]|nr:hypothetical protein [Patescibacteria group bacterium]
KTQQLQSILQLLDSSVTKQEVFDIFKQLMQLMKDVKDTNTQEWSLMRSAFSMLESKLTKVATDFQKSSAFNALKKEVDLHLNSALADFKKQNDVLSREQWQSIYDKLATLRDGEPGVPGKDADEEAVAQRIRDELATMFADELKKLREEIERRPFGRVGGGVSDSAVKFSLGRLIQKETPSGDIDGVNKAYTVSQTIHSVISLVINGEPITDDEYTVSGHTITMTTALPAALSGLSFRILYV